MKRRKFKRAISYLRWMERAREWDHKCIECNARVHKNLDYHTKAWSIIGHDKNCMIAMALDDLNEVVLWKEDEL